MQTIDEYIKQFFPSLRTQLELLRKTILEVAPQATEAIKYGMPTFVLRDNLVHFAAYKSHIGLYPAPSAIEAFNEELKPYKTSKGAIQFPINQPLPLDIIRRIVEFRVREQLGK